MRHSPAPPGRQAKERIFAAAVAVACAASTAVAQNVSYDLSTNQINRTAWERQPYVSNGYIGQRIPAEGFGYREVAAVNASAHDGTQGWPLFTPRQTAAMVAGFYDQQNETAGTNFAQTGGQQPISTLPTWSSLYFTVNNQTYSTMTPDAQISNWTQSMSVADGVVRTSLNWTPTNTTKPIRLTYTVFAHRVEPNIGAVRLTVEGLQQGMQVAFTDVFDGAGAWRTDFVTSGPVPNTTNTLHTAVRPVGISNVTAYEVSVIDVVQRNASWSNDTGASCLGPVLSTNASTASACYRLMSNLTSNSTLDVVKYVGIASSDAFPGVELQTALAAAKKANSTGWDGILASHRKAWDAVWADGDIEIPGQENQELQIATRASLFHILTNIRNGSEPTGLGDNSIAPAGLTSDSYAGQIFWDADIWMAPSLMSLFPDYAESVVDYRYRQLGAAKENAKKFNLSGSLYPWTGARFGNCTGIGPCADYEYHLNSDIALAAWQYYAVTNNKTWLEEKGYPIVRGAADMFASFVVRNDTGNGTYEYVTLNTTGADEYANHVNNTGLTNGALTVTLRQAIELSAILNRTDVPSNWTDIRDKTLIPQAQSGIILGYDGTNGSATIKQADVVLLQYPYEFQWPNNRYTESRADSIALSTLDFYSGANSPDGPAMTWSIYSALAAELSPIGCSSYVYFLRSVQPYSRAPYYQFSEQQNDVWTTNGGTNPAFTFLTGHGGYLQTLTHGFTGYRFRLDRLYFNPSLPPQLTNYTVKGMKWHGGVFDVNVNTNETTIVYRSGGNGSVPVEIGHTNAKGGNYTLEMGKNITIPTRSTSGTLVQGNLAQCQAVLSNDTRFHLDNSTNRPGEYALAAVDGSNSTVWQPQTTNATSMLVDLGAQQPIKAFHINWGNKPAQMYSIAVSNASTAYELQNATSVASGNVTLSAPYNLAQSLIVQVDLGNLTDVPLQKNVTARFVQLTIAGSFGTTGYGGTVGEFAVIGA